MKLDLFSTNKNLHHGFQIGTACGGFLTTKVRPSSAAFNRLGESEYKASLESLMTASVETIWTALLLLMGVGGSAIAGQSAATAETPAVRLEPHEGKTQFLLGDPIRVDLVFTRQEPGYTVNTNPYTYLPIPDQIDVRPARGLEPIAYACCRGADGYARSCRK